MDLFFLPLKCLQQYQLNVIRVTWSHYGHPLIMVKRNGCTLTINYLISPSNISILTLSTSKVSESTSTISPVSSNLGRASSLTTCPSGPSMTAVSNLGCDPTKKRWGHDCITKGSSSWKGYDPIESQPRIKIEYLGSLQSVSGAVGAQHRHLHIASIMPSRSSLSTYLNTSSIF